MRLEPGKSKNKILFSEAQNCKKSVFCMCPILRDDINHFRYLACLLINWYGLGKLTDVEVVSFYKTSVDKDASSFKVNQSLHREKLGCVSGLKYNKEVEKDFMNIESTESKTQKKSFSYQGQ